MIVQFLRRFLYKSHKESAYNYNLSYLQQSKSTAIYSSKSAMSLPSSS